MARFNMCFYKYLILFLVFLSFNINLIRSQGNCLLYAEGSGERTACELSYLAIEHRQGSIESQKLFDQAIKIGPKYAYAYYQKSVPFFKRGRFAEAISLLNKAIELEPQNYLYYRAYYYYYSRSYDLCIKDLEELYMVHKASYVTTPGGELEMRLLLATSYAFLENIDAGIDWLHKLINVYEDQPHLKGLYDHFCFGVLYFENNQYELAIKEFEKQLDVNKDFADTYYYLGMIKEKDNQYNLATDYYQQALDKMNRINGGYSNSLFPEFKIDKNIVKNKIESL